MLLMAFGSGEHNPREAELYNNLVFDQDLTQIQCHFHFSPGVSGALRHTNSWKD